MSDVASVEDVASVAYQVIGNEISNKKLPGHLLQLQKLVRSVSSDQLSDIIHDIWQLKLLDVIAVVLKMDFTAVPPDSWTSAASLVRLAVQFLTHEQGKVEFDRDPRQSELMVNILVESILECARNCGTRYSGLLSENAIPSSGNEKLYCLRALKEIFYEINNLLGHYTGLTGNVLRSANLSHLFMSETDDIAMLTVNLIGKLYAEPSSVPSDFDGQEIVEECLFKMATTTNVQTARECLTTLSNIINFKPHFANVINARFKGVKEMVEDNWIDHLKLSQDELKEFFRLIDARDAVKLIHRAMNPKLEATLIIQAYIRSYLERKRLKLANAAFSKLQRKWRERKNREMEERFRHEKDETVKFQLFLSKNDRVRKSRQILLKQMLATPAEQFPGFLDKLEQSAAARIQATWRGHLARRKYSVESEQERRNKAAHQIQGSYRRFKARNKEAADDVLASLKGPVYHIPELTPERRSELEREIQYRAIDYKTRHPNVLWSKERLSILHERGQDALVDYYSRILKSRRNMLECETAMARIAVDFDTLRETCPKVETATQEDIDRLSCPSKPIRNRAAYEHKQTLQSLLGPWWAQFAHDTQVEQEEYRHLMFAPTITKDDL